MKINGQSYDIIYPLQVDWKMGITRKAKSNGFYKTYDYGLSSDKIKAIVTFKGLRDDLEALLIKLNQGQDLTVESEGELFLGAHVKYDGVIFNAIASDVKPIERLNTNFWSIEVPLNFQDVELNSAITPSLDSLSYPSAYIAGRVYTQAQVIYSTYGSVSSSYNGRQAINELTLSTYKQDVAGEVIKGFVEVIRGDAFVLPVKWQSLQPFGEMNYNSALLMSLSFAQDSLKGYTITVRLQGFHV